MIPSTQSFDAYALVGGVETQLASSEVKVQLIRRAHIPFGQVSHIRDDMGLNGRPVSMARDGSRLGIPAGRVLCRAIDKRAFSNDPVHYKDQVYHPRLITATAYPSTIRPSKADSDFLVMDYKQYLEEFSKRRDKDETVPTIDQIVHS